MMKKKNCSILLKLIDPYRNLCAKNAVKPNVKLPVQLQTDDNVWFESNNDRHWLTYEILIFFFF